MATGPVLDLLTDTARLTIKIDHVDYELRGPSDLTLEDYKTLERIGPRMAVLLMQDALPTADAAELSRLLDLTCRLALIAPEEVLARLGDLHRVPIAKIFIELLSPSLLRTRAMLSLEAPSPLAGTNSSRASHASTAARRQPGSVRRRSGSSART